MKKIRPLNEEKNKAIIKASIEEFYEKGFDGSSMDNISKNANVSKATVYKHFKNKEELFLSLYEIFKQRLANSFKYTYSKEKSIETQLYEIAKKEMDFLKNKENIKLIRIMTVVMVQRKNIGEKIITSSKDDYLIMTTKWFEVAKQEGKLDFDNSAFIARQFIGMIKSFAFLPQLYGADVLTKEEEEEVINKSVQMILKLYSK